MSFNFLLIGIGIVIGIAVTLIIQKVRLRPSHAFWGICVVTLVFGIGTGFNALLHSAPTADAATRAEALKMWIAVSALAVSGIMATFAAKLRQAGH